MGLALGITLAGLCNAQNAAAGVSIDFEFEDARYLLAWQRQGARVHVPEQVGDEPVPLVIFLHGTNSTRQLHAWMSEKSYDLRPLLDDLIGRRAMAPVVFAAPSHTRRANIRHIWDGFDTAAFVARTRAALGDTAQIDPTRVVLVGHSGAGCNPNGGLLRAASRSEPLFGLIALDVCMNADYGLSLGKSRSASVGVFWQVESWKRDFDEFRSAFLDSRSGFGEALDTFEEVSVPGRDAHNEIVPRVLTLALPQLFPPTPASEP